VNRVLVLLGLTLSVGALLLGLSACERKAVDTSAMRNVVLISIDSLRADHCGCYGYDKPTTPALDAFAAEAVRFANTYAISPWTLPSHASMFTGLYPDTHLANRPRSKLHENNVTLAELLGKSDYFSHGIVCAPFLRSYFQLNQGFNTYDDRISRTHRPEVRQIKTSRDVTDRALEFLAEQQRQRRPFFLFVHYWDPHYDYNPPERYANMFDPDYTGDIDGLRISHRDDIVPGFNPRDLQHIVALYDGEIRYTDDHLAELLAELNKPPFAQNTAVIITADHGEEFLEHGSTGHTFTCFEELIRVPLLVRAPWMETEAKVIDTLVEIVDLFPTILTLAGQPAAEHDIHGYDLLPLIERGQAPPREVFFCETQQGRRYGWEGMRGDWFSLRDLAGMKVHYFRRGRINATDLFNLAADPYEKTNLRKSQKELSEQMALQLRRLHRDHSRQARQMDIRTERTKKRKKRKTREEKDLEEQLKGLGYVN